jgi:DNA polymerase (family 10)
VARQLTNREIADALEELGDLYELDGADRYRVAAYRRAAETVRGWPRSVAEAVAAGRARELPGIGQTLEEKLKALLQQGEIPQAKRLRERYPPGLREVMRVPGIGARRARLLFEQLGIDSFAALQAAASEGRISTLKGFGKAFEQAVLEAQPQLDSSEGRPLLLSEALELAEQFEQELAVQLTVVGEARRGVELVQRLSLLAAAEQPGLVPRFAGLALVERVEAEGEGWLRARTHSGAVVELHLAPWQRWGSALVGLTGSEAHLNRLARLGLRLDGPLPWVSGSDGPRYFATEADLYAHLGLAEIPPELREDRGEVEAAAADTLPDLVAVSDLKGDLHCHTIASDGRATIEQLAQAARERGYHYIAITDHSASHGFGRAVSAKQLRAQIERVRALHQRSLGIEVLIGSEVNILPDGSLDYPDELLAELDWVVASVHTAFNQDRERITERIVRALHHPYVDCLGHPSGRLLGQRPPYRVDLERVVREAVRTGTFLEINANPLRRDLDEHHARLAVELGGMVVINSDAHEVANLDLIRFGVATARRGWVAKERVANARPWPELAALRKRGRA